MNYGGGLTRGYPNPGDESVRLTNIAGDRAWSSFASKTAADSNAQKY